MNSDRGLMKRTTFTKNRLYSFNVPFGRYANPYFPEKEMLYFWEKSQTALFLNMDFRETMQLAKQGDVVYCDPPYVPLSDTSNFTEYGPSGFGEDEQKELARLARQLASKGVPVLISNHDTAFTREQYAGAHIFSFDVRRSISCKERNRASEILAFFNG